MTLTNASSRPTAALTAILSAVALLIALVGAGNQPARADKFTPLEDPPTIAFMDLKVGSAAGVNEASEGRFKPAGFDAFEGFNPGYEGSSEIYNVFADISSNAADWGNNITTVRLCLYDAAEVTADVATACGIPDSGTGPLTVFGNLPESPDPRSVFIMEYDADAGFRTRGTNAFADASGGDASAINFETEETGAADIRFSFVVSHVMAESADWRVRLAVESQPPAFDQDGELWDPEGPGDPGECTVTDTPEGCVLPDRQSGVAEHGTAFTTNYFGSMLLGRNSLDTSTVDVNFGLLAAGASKQVKDITTGTYTANNASVLAMHATDFESGGTTLPLSGAGDVWDTNDGRGLEGTFDAAGSWANLVPNTVSLDCAYDTDTDFGDITADSEEFRQIGLAPRVFATEIAASTDEDPQATETHTCVLTYAGGAGETNTVFGNTVTIGILKSGDALGAEVTLPAQSETGTAAIAPPPPS